MKLRRLLGTGAAGVLALAFPLGVQAMTFTTLTVTPSTHSQYATVHLNFTTDAKQVKSMEFVPPTGSAFCHHGAACSPADGTKVGTMSVNATWLPLCTVSTMGFDGTWVAPDGSYTPPSGWSVVAQVNWGGTLATIKWWIIEDSSGNYKIEEPSMPTLTCSGHTATYDITLGAYGGNTYSIYQNPASVGSATWTINIVDTDNSTTSSSKSYTVS